MWADIDTKRDFLNYGEAAALVVDVIEDSRMLPTSIGVFGSWGTGKSTLLNIIEDDLKARQATSTAIIVRFDAWLYQGYDDAKAALMDVISDALIGAAEKSKDQSFLERAKGLAGRVRWFRAAGVAAEAGAALLGMPLLGAARAAAASAERLAGGQGDEGDVKHVREGVKEIHDKTKDLVTAKAERTPPKQVDEFTAEFGKLLSDIDRMLVVFVDNLDRCMPQQTIRTLEAMRLFLFMNKTAFVVAADEAMVRQSVKTHFADIDGTHVTDYLDKLIQIPLRVPRLGVREVRAYLFQLLADASSAPQAKQDELRAVLTDNMQAAWKDDPSSVEDVVAVLGHAPSSEEGTAFFTADRISHLLAMHPVNGNPRLIKRMLNVVRMRAKLARRRDMPVSEDLIAKVALFERCMGEDATKQFYAMVQEATDGKVVLFSELEDVVAKPEFADKLPETWKKNAPLLQQWFALEPRVSGDLRAIAYLGRDTAALTVRRSALSQAGRDAVNLLLDATSINQSSPKAALAKVPLSEMSIIMEAITAHLRTQLDWSSQPKGWQGAQMLVEHAPSTKDILKRVIAERTQTKVPPWLKAAAKSKDWLSTVVKT